MERRQQPENKKTRNIDRRQQPKTKKTRSMDRRLQRIKGGRRLQRPTRRRSNRFTACGVRPKK